VNLGLTLSGIFIAGTAVVAGHALTQPVSTGSTGSRGQTGGTASVGPDVIVGAIPDVARYAPGTYQGVQYGSYAFGSTSCNIGNQQLLWQPNPDPDHPVIPQNFYRIKNGAIEQIGLSWVKHGFCALQQNLCGACTPAGGGCPTVLGIGCSDPYTASLNGAQGDLKSRGPINPTTGIFSGNYSDPAAPSGLPTSLRERCMIARSDLDPAQNAGAVFVAECQYIHPQDAAAGNDDNNASYRLATVGSTWSSSLGYPITLTGPTVQQKPAIFAWQATHSDVSFSLVDVPGDGRFIVGGRAIDQGDGTWRYEYAVYNLNSDRAGGSFSIAIPQGVTISNVGFKAPKYLNGEPYTNAAWTTTEADGMLTFACEPYSQTVNGNAIRWSTLYNFRFTANSGPTTATGSLGLFKPGAAGAPTAMPFTGPMPTEVVVACPADLDGNGEVAAQDLAAVLAAWGPCSGACPADIDGNGEVAAQDLAAVLAAWGACP
jgi:hypothetical protein